MKAIPTIFAISTASVLLLSGCGASRTDWGFMRPAQLIQQPPAGPIEYQQGWIDGCESGYAGYSNPSNKMFHSWRQDPILARNPVYYQSWKDAYQYCATWGMMTDDTGIMNHE